MVQKDQRTGRDLQEMVEETRTAIPRPNSDEVPLESIGSVKVNELAGHMRPQLEVSTGKQRGRLYAIRKPLVMLGRVPDVVDIVIPDEAASRHHAAVGHFDGVFTLYDLHSTNGTLVDGERVASAQLCHGTQFQIGETVMTFWLDC